MAIYTPFFPQNMATLSHFFPKEICWIQSLPISLSPSDEISPSKKKKLVSLNMRARRGFFFAIFEDLAKFSYTSETMFFSFSKCQDAMR
jgi:hypothetical protein